MRYNMLKSSRAQFEHKTGLKSEIHSALLFVVVFALFWFTPAARADWSFVMLGDTRGERGSTTTGVSLHLNTIAHKISLLNPDMVLAACRT